MLERWLRRPHMGKETARVYTEASLNREWTRQVKRLIKLGFHTEIGLTAKEYVKSLPMLTPQPESFKGRLDRPVLVETRIPMIRQCELAGIDYSLLGYERRARMLDLQKHILYMPPSAPYTFWTDEGARSMNREVKDVWRELSDDERGGTISDGVALYIASPSVLRKRSLFLLGTEVGERYDYVAHLTLWRGHPKLVQITIHYADPKSGSLICGREK